MGHADGALLALMAAAAASRLGKDESPHVVIEVHASSPVQRTPAEAGLGGQQQGPQQTTGPLPIVLDNQQPSADALQRYTPLCFAHCSVCFRVVCFRGCHLTDVDLIRKWFEQTDLGKKMCTA